MFQSLGNDECILISKEEYEKIVRSYEEYLKSTTLFSLVGDNYTYKARNSIDMYEALTGADIDWSFEVVLFTHDW